jgi:hypothetical protein
MELVRSLRTQVYPPDWKVKRAICAIIKLHVNLGHASKADMGRILRHHHVQ